LDEGEEVTPDQPQAKKLGRRGGRRLLIFYIVVFVVLGLMTAGVLLYRPLKLRYAIARAREDNGYYPHNEADRWLTYCVNEAIRGDLEAMEVAVNRPWIQLPGRRGRIHEELKLGNPELFLKALDTLPDNRAVTILSGLGAATDGLGSGKVERLQVLVELEGRFGDPQLARHDREARFARLSLDYIRSRFSAELAEVETRRKAESENPKIFE
jgi:hypothetical protein